VLICGKANTDAGFQPILPGADLNLACPWNHTVHLSEDLLSARLLSLAVEAASHGKRLLFRRPSPRVHNGAAFTAPATTTGRRRFSEFR
jgi:hypothetical protein